MGLSRSTNGMRRPWTRFVTLAIAGTFVCAAVGLGVGLGVGLTRRDDHANSGSANSGPFGRSNSSDDPNGIQDGPERTSIWRPSVNETWQIVLQGSIKLDSSVKIPDPDVSIYDLDVFVNDASVFKTLQNDGKKVICYFSAGSYEDFRPDKDRFTAADLGKVLDGWPNEKWLKLSSPNVRSIMSDRIKLAASKGCDAIDPDNVDGYVSRLLFISINVKRTEADA